MINEYIKSLMNRDPEAKSRLSIIRFKLFFF